MPRRFFARATVRVARGLLGCFLESRIGGRRTIGRIVEVEAYVGPHDPAAHGFGNRRTSRNDALFGPPGTSYVYFIYGAHWCFNAVTEADGYPAAVLVRALEPVAGLAEMARRRALTNPRVLCAGPGRLCQALGITGAHNARPLQGAPLRILRPPDGAARPRVATSSRIGITKAAERPLRFCIRDSPWLSRKG